MSLFDQLNVIDETTYGVGVAPTRSFEYISEAIKGTYARIESNSVRQSNRVLRSDRFMPNPKGANGPVVMEVGTKGFGFWLKYLLGNVATTGPTDGTAYTHTGTLGNLTGKSFTTQVGRALDGGVSGQPFTWEGCKVTSWELSCATDGILELHVNIDASKESAPSAPSGIYILQATTYPASPELLTFAGGTVSVGGSQLGLVRKLSIKGDNKLKTDRYGIRGSTLKREPLEAGLRDITVDLETEFDTHNQQARFASATAAGALVTFSAAFTGTVLAGAATVMPSLTASVPALRLDGDPAMSNGFDINTQMISGKAVFDGTNSPITLAYVTSDATP